MKLEKVLQRTNLDIEIYSEQQMPLIIAIMEIGLSRNLGRIMIFRKNTENLKEKCLHLLNNFFKIVLYFN